MDKVIGREMVDEDVTLILFPVIAQDVKAGREQEEGLPNYCGSVMTKYEKVVELAD